MSVDNPPSRRDVFLLGAGLSLGAVAPSTIAEAAAPLSDALTATARTASGFVERGATPGVMVAVAHQWRPVFQQGFGSANLETSTPVDGRCIFRIGSMTKQFTAAAVLRLSEAGKLNLDDRLSRFLPDFPRAGEVSLREMLNHTAGLHNFTEDLDNHDVERRDLPLSRFVTYLARRPIIYDFNPGTAKHYSNTGYVLLGAVIERAASEPYSIYLRREVLDRAGLVATAVDHATDIVPHRASGYEVQSPGVYRNGAFLSMSIPGAAGALRSRADDLLAWRKALFAGAVVSRDSLAQMLAPARLNDGSRAELKVWPDPAMGDPESDYGFGLVISHRAGELVVDHLGGINGYTANATTCPRLGLTLVVLCNGPSAKPVSDAAFPALLRAAKATSLA